MATVVKFLQLEKQPEPTILMSGGSATSGLGPKNLSISVRSNEKMKSSTTQKFGSPVK
jgi:hypothetical protein